MQVQLPQPATLAEPSSAAPFVDPGLVCNEGADALDAITASPSGQRCDFCGASNTPLWRRGPQGKNTLCNACGIRWSSQLGNKTGDSSAINSDDEVSKESGLNQLEEGAANMQHLFDSFASSARGKIMGSESHSSSSVDEDEGEDEEPIEGLSSPQDEEGNPTEGDELADAQGDMIDEDDEARGDDDVTSSPPGGRRGRPSGRPLEGAKDEYYCKYCDTSWPHNHFRNAQQFGAHCSNCSRKRKVKDPQELTIRERNKRMRKSRKAGRSLLPDPVAAPLSPTRKRKRSADGGAEPSSAAESQKRAALARQDKRHRSADDADDEEESESEGVATPASSPRLRPRPPTASPSASRKPGEERKKKKRAMRGSRRRRSARHAAGYKVVTPDSPLDQEELIRDPNSLGGLLFAVETKLNEEKLRQEILGAKQRIVSVRKEVAAKSDVGVGDLKYKAAAMLQELRVDMIAKLESLKSDVASELAFREVRRRQRLNDMKIQMTALRRILENGKKDRQNGLLACLGGAQTEKFNAAMQQLEQLQKSLCADLAAREVGLQQQFAEMKATCLLHLQDIKQQMNDELNVHEERMEKELEEMRYKLHSVCAQIGSDIHGDEDEQQQQQQSQSPASAGAPFEPQQPPPHLLPHQEAAISASPPPASVPLSRSGSDIPPLVTPRTGHPPFPASASAAAYNQDLVLEDGVVAKGPLPFPWDMSGAPPLTSM